MQRRTNAAFLPTGSPRVVGQSAAMIRKLDAPYPLHCLNGRGGPNGWHAPTTVVPWAIARLTVPNVIVITGTTKGAFTMRSQISSQHRFYGKVALASGAIALAFVGQALAEQAKSAAEEGKNAPVVRTFGAKGGYRTEVTSDTKGTLSEDDRRQIAVLTAQVFQHIDEARDALGGDDMTLAKREVENAWHALKAIRAIEPKTAVHTRTTAPDGAVVYEDLREVRENVVPLFEGMIHAQTLAPIVDAKRDAITASDAEVKGVRLIESESIRTEALADLGVVESQLHKASKAARRQEGRRRA